MYKNWLSFPSPHTFFVDNLYDFQATNGKQGGLSVNPPALHNPIGGSHISLLASQNTQKHHHKQVGALIFSIEKLPKAAFL
jgi:hypothetical protein